jgi:hypothetical protein
MTDEQRAAKLKRIGEVQRASAWITKAACDAAEEHKLTDVELLGIYLRLAQDLQRGMGKEEG